MKTTARPALEHLAIEDLSVAFGGVQAVRHVSFRVGGGEIFGLIGPNGAGKTTVLNLISRLQRPDQGDVLWNGSPLPRRASRLQSIGMVRTFQNPKVIDDCTVLENVMLGGHRLARAGMFRAAIGTPSARREEHELRGRAEEVLERAGYDGDLSAPGSATSFAERRKIELARCLMTAPALVLLDEPTSGLDPSEIAALVATVQQLNRGGANVVLVEHNVPVVVSLCHRIGLLVLGELVTTGPTEALVRDPQVVAAYLGETATASGDGTASDDRQGRPSIDLGALDMADSAPSTRTNGIWTHSRTAGGEPSVDTDAENVGLVVSELCSGYGALQVLRGLSLRAAGGEVTLVVGRNGVGKSTLFNALGGLIPTREGTILWRGRHLERRNPRERASVGLGLVPQGGGVIRGQTVRENLQLALFGMRCRRAEAHERIDEVLELFPSLAARIGERSANLSGGERQMLAIGKVLVKRPSLLLLDEPSIGLAPRVLEELHDLVERLCRSGMTVCVAEQNIRWCRDLATHGYLLDEGRIVQVLTGRTLTDEREVAALFLGTDRPNDQTVETMVAVHESTGRN